MPKITSESRQFLFDGLQPGKTYRAVVRAFDSQNNRIGRSATIEFKTNTKDTPPPPVTNLTGSYDGSTLQVSWDYDEFPNDFSEFIVNVSDSPSQGPSSFDTSRTQSFTLGYNELLTLFQTVPLTIYVNVVARDRSRNQSTAVEISITAEPLDDPTNVTAEASIAGYNVSWDEVETPAYNYTRIYESDTVGGTYQVVYTSATTPVFVPSTNYTERFIKVSHVSDAGLETNLVASVPASVTPINPNVIDNTPPEQRTDILFTAAEGSVEVSWTNPTSESLNSDVAGVSIRYAKTESPSNYTWVSVPFTFSAPATSTTITGLLPNTSYEFELATFDKSQNYTDYSTAQTVVTLSDSTPPPAPVAPTVAAGSTAGGPFVVRVTQESIESGTTNPLPIDTSYFKIFMLDSGFTTAPAAGVNTDLNASEVGTLIAAFNGGESQSNFYIPLTDGEQRYFYTRAVDTSSNVSDASAATQSSAMTVIDNAYISDLSADKITAGRLNADEYIQVGTSSEQITIKSSTTLGQIYSGIGTYNSSDTGVYIDTSGKFSLKDRLTFDGTDLTVSGTVNASGGTFTGNVGIGASGGIYIGSDPNSGARIVLNNTSIGGYSSDTGNPQIFLFTTSGVSNISGWSITPSTIEKASGGTSIKLDSDNSRIVAGAGNDTAGIQSSASGEVAIWAGSDTGTESSPFYVKNNGFLYALNAEISGVITGSRGIFTGQLAPSGIALTYNSTETRIPTVTIDSGDGGTDGSYLSFLRRAASNEDSAIEFFIETTDPTKAFRRGRISHDTGSGGEFNIIAYPSSTGLTPGRLTLSALDGDGRFGEIVLDSSRTFTQRLFITQPIAGDYATEITTNFWKDPDSVSNGSTYFKVGSDLGSAVTVKKDSNGIDKVIIKDYDIDGDNYLINDSRINVGGIQIGKNLNSTSKDGIRVDSNNFWYDPDSVSSSEQYFKVGNSSGTNFIILEKDGDIKFKGNITGGNFSGSVAGPIIPGDLDQNVVKIGVDVLDSSDGIAFNNNNFWLVPATVATGNTIFKIASGGPNSTTTYIEVVKGGEVSIKGYYQGGEIQAPLPTTPTLGGESLVIGVDVEGNKDGIYLNEYNYWYLPSSIDDGSNVLRIGSETNYVAYDGLLDVLSVSGSILASSGTIGGWEIGVSSISSTTTGTYPITLDSTEANPKIYIGQGAHASVTTPFYADSEGRFSIGDKLFFDPSDSQQFGTLTVVGRVRGAIDNVQIVPSDSGTFTVSQVIISGTAPDQIATLTTSAPHTFIPGDTVIISGITGDAAVVNGAWAIASKTSDTFVIEGIPSATNNTYTGLSGSARVRELTMGLHAALNGSPAGLGIRLDENNYWFVNNQFRVGTSGSYFKWDGANLVVKGRVEADSGYFPAGLITGQITASQINTTGLIVSGAVNTQYLNTVGGADSFNVRVSSSFTSGGSAFVGFYNSSASLIGLINSNSNNSLNISGISSSSDVTLQSNRNLYLRSTSDMIVLSNNLRGTQADSYYRPVVISTSSPSTPSGYSDGSLWVVY